MTQIIEAIILVIFGLVVIGVGIFVAPTIATFVVGGLLLLGGILSLVLVLTGRFKK